MYVLPTGCSESTEPAREESSTNPQLNDAPAETQEAQPDADNSASDESPTSLDGLLPKQLAPLTVSWTGDLDGMAERRVVRALVVPGGPQFFYYRGKPRGAIAELLVLLQKELNDNLGAQQQVSESRSEWPYPKVAPHSSRAVGCRCFPYENA